MGFSKKTFEFLIENKMRNSKEWFTDNKHIYDQYVLQPLVELVDGLAPSLLKIDPEICVEPKINKTISRIYRDVRFSRDKSLYRDVMWTVFCRRGHMDKELTPALVFEISPQGYRVGCGYYTMPAPVYKAVVDLVMSEDKEFITASKAFDSQDRFEMIGQPLLKKKMDVDDAKKKWIERKSVAIFRTGVDFEALYSENFADILIADFRLLTPYYNFLVKAAFKSLSDGNLINRV